MRNTQPNKEHNPNTGRVIDAAVAESRAKLQSPD